jgi:hypothetical protein
LWVGPAALVRSKQILKMDRPLPFGNLPKKEFFGILSLRGNFRQAKLGKIGTHKKCCILDQPCFGSGTALIWLGPTHSPPQSLIVGWESPGSPLPIDYCTFLKHLESKNMLSQPADSTWASPCSPLYFPSLIFNKLH